MASTRARRWTAAALAVVLVGGCEPAVDEPDVVDPHEVAFDLLDALAIAAEHEPGGISIEVELTDDGDGLVYDVDRVVDHQTREILIDADTGDVVSTRVDPEDQVEGNAQAEALETSSDGVTLERAIQAALDTMSGTAVSAEIEVDDGVILVVLLEGQTGHAVAIDLDTGVVVDTAADPEDD